MREYLEQYGEIGWLFETEQNVKNGVACYEAMYAKWLPPSGGQG